MPEAEPGIYIFSYFYPNFLKVMPDTLAGFDLMTQKLQPATGQN
jgi:hypothetical protein